MPAASLGLPPEASVAEALAEGADLLTLSDAAALLGVHPATLRRWADQGDVLVMVTPGGTVPFM